MFVLVWRTVVVRVCSDTLIVFEAKETGGTREPPSDDFSNAAGHFASRVCEGWETQTSTVAWADRGHWVTTDATDEDSTCNANWFRIGFGPLFVDFTQSGAWYTVFTLAQVGGCGVNVPIGLCHESMHDGVWYRSVRSTNL